MTELRDRISCATRVHVAGDWHGDTAWATAALDALDADGCQVLLHAGDFGYFPKSEHGVRYLEIVSALAVSRGIQILVTPGNHSDYDAINAGLEQTGGEPFEAATNVHLLPRGWRWTISDRTFVSLGGATSIDQLSRFAGLNWWPEEAITQADADAAAAAGLGDIFITHDAPLRDATFEVDHTRNDPSWRLPEWLEAQSRNSGRLVQLARDAIAPKLHFHGHWHLPGSSNRFGNRAVISLGMNGQVLNLAALNLEDLSWSELPVSEEASP